SFLLLLAIVDDAVGMAIIALFYPDPLLPPAPLWLMSTLAGMAAAMALRSTGTRNYWPYLLCGGIPSWIGLHNAHLHPALALVFIVPFLPHPGHEHKHLFEEDLLDRSTLARFEHEWKLFVDLGLFLFGFANAGVPVSAVGTATGLVFFALLIGKCVGVFTFTLMGKRFGFPLPRGMGKKELFVAGIVAGLGFTVALFVAGEAFTDKELQGAAKMGAMLSFAIAPLAWVVARFIGIEKRR
ncbi:MAG TPA: Na+/H+ antiporter NhaA, partial [Geobacteraceae bacterium]